MPVAEDFSFFWQAGSDDIFGPPYPTCYIVRQDGILSVNFTSAPDMDLMPDLSSTDEVDDTYFDAVSNWVTNTDTGWEVSLNAIYTSNPISPGHWFQLLLAVNSVPASIGIGSTLKTFVNGSQLIPDSGPTVISSSEIMQSLLGSSADGFASDSQVNWVSLGPGSITHNVDITTTLNTVPAVQMDFSGKPFSFPIDLARVASDYGSGLSNSISPIRYADIYVYPEYIDPATHFTTFVNVAGGHGTPQDPNAVVAALGDPFALFTGGKTVFSINRGTGGLFSATGTINDVPGPSY